VTDFFIKDLDGRDTTLEEIVKDKPTLFIFVRHFG
jgi:hypothetical protein